VSRAPHLRPSLCLSRAIMVSGGSSQMEMDYEDDYKAALRASAAETQPAPAVVADDAHPFDLDAYIANYSGAPARIYPHPPPHRQRARMQGAQRSTGSCTSSARAPASRTRRPCTPRG
jgi:hypothetical protein